MKNVGNVQSIFDLFDKRWALVTAGDGESFNTMTISWGALGTLWNLPAVTVYVRPSRYTHEFLEREPLFTVSFFGEAHRKELGILGSLSGRDSDKLKLTGLNAKIIETPEGRTVGFAEAEHTFVCRRIFRQDMDKAHVLPEIAEAHYSENEPAHTMYVGEVIGVIASANRQTEF